MCEVTITSELTAEQLACSEESEVTMRNWIEVVGRIWLPPVKVAQTIDLSAGDVGNVGEQPTRDDVQSWLDCHAGDFQEIIDFHAVLGETEIPWETEEGVRLFDECICSNER